MAYTNNSAMAQNAFDSSSFETYSMARPEGSDLTVFSARRKGISHTKKKMPCQDFCKTAEIKYAQVKVVSDGVSSCLRSAEGSQFACEAVIEAASDAAEECSSEEEFVSKLCGIDYRRSILNTWHRKIKADISSKDGKAVVTLDDIYLYGATLMFAVTTDNYIVCGNIGDGQILLFNEFESVKVRKHLPKQSSVTNALCNIKCVEESFFVCKYRREDFSGVLLSTDGIYDRLENNTVFHRYAKQLCDRFTENNEPLQPFCFKEGNGNTVDIFSELTTDDCSVILCLDRKPLSPDFMNISTELSRKFERNILVSCSDKAYLYAVKDNDSYKYVAVTRDKPLDIPDISGNCFTFAKRTAVWSDKGLYYSLYDYSGNYKLNYEYRYFSNVFAERDEADYGPGASDTASLYNEYIYSCEKALEENGYRFNSNSPMLTFITDGGLVIIPEAVSKTDKPDDIDIFSTLANHLGYLTIGGTRKPLFVTGIINEGSFVHYPDTASAFCSVIKSDSGYALRNHSGCDWITENGETISNGGSVSLRDALSFTSVNKKNEKTKITFRKEGLFQ